MLLLSFYSDNVYLDLFVCLLISLLVFSFLHLRSSLCVILLFYETCPLDFVEVFMFILPLLYILYFLEL